MSRYLRTLSTLIAAAIGLAFPASYYALQTRYHQGTLRTEANINAALVAHRLVQQLGEPTLLSAPGVELELLESVESDVDENDYNERYERRSLLNAERKPIVASATPAPLDWPVIGASSPIQHNGQTLGYFYVERSLRPVLKQTAWFALLGAAIAWVLCFVMRRLPLRALDFAEKRLSHLAQHDALTNLSNRAALHQQISDALAASSRSGAKLALLYLDLDRFKLANDTYGHKVGDQLLRIAAERLVNAVRATDVVARASSDEFALLLKDLRSEEQACVVAQKLLEKFRAPLVINGQSFLLTLSIGIAFGPTDGASAEELLRNADSAMHHAKQAQRDNYQLYDRRMHEQLQTRLRMEHLLHTALTNNEFALNYQPFVDAARGEVVGVEALLRWHSPVLGLVSPVAFIDILEETGLIVPVGAWVLQQSCGQAKQWLDQGLGPLVLSVNVSARQFKDSELVATVLRVLEQTGFPAHLLQLEITESVLMADQSASAEKLRHLADRGIRIAIDDFGTGYSSLGYLKRFSLNTLKIDRSFVKDMNHDADNASIVSAVISLAHNLRLSVTAEGVETAEQLAMLRQNKCDCLQGYFFSKPLSSADTQSFLRAQRAEKPALQLVRT